MTSRGCWRGNGVSRASGSGRVVAAVLAGVMGCGGAEAGALTVVDAYAAEPVTVETGAVYFRVVNPRPTADTLLTATCDIAARALVHEQRAVGGMVHMHAAEAVPVPARGALQLRPGGLHLMLQGLTARPRAGDTIRVTLQFAQAGAIEVRAPVISYAEVAARAGGGGEDDR